MTGGSGVTLSQLAIVLSGLALTAAGFYYIGFTNGRNGQ